MASDVLPPGRLIRAASHAKAGEALNATSRVFRPAGLDREKRLDRSRARYIVSVTQARKASHSSQLNLPKAPMPSAVRSWSMTLVHAATLLLGLPANATATAQAARAPVAALIGQTAFKFPYPTRDGWLAFVRATPGAAGAANACADQVSADDYSRYAAGEAREPTRIIYRSDGLLIRGLVVRPGVSGPDPVIIFNHGGVMRWGRITQPAVLAFNRLGERDYIVFASAYRGEMGSEGQPDMGGGDVADVLALLGIVDTLPGADRDRIGMWDFSRGGLVTYGVLARTNRIEAAVVVGGPPDLTDAPWHAASDRFIHPLAIRDYAADSQEVPTRRSPIRWPEKLATRSPILLLQGGDGSRVAPTDALRMTTALRGLNRPYRLKLYERGSHDRFENGADGQIATARWFDRYLRDARAAPRNGVTDLPADEAG